MCNNPGILPMCSRVSTTVWLHYLDSYEILGDKARGEQNDDAACCFKQIPEAALHKTEAVRSLTSHLTKDPRKTNKTHWVLLVE